MEIHMPRVSAAQYQKKVGYYNDLALSEPVEITKHDRDHLTVIRTEEYRRLLERERRALRAEELSDAELEAIAGTEMDPQHNHLNELLK